ncbi:hypothetical protein [Candidatus Odyssella acanthamoebae]|uniref:Uncharacterized protein n=1 Tax=Candidatus Odyssella acanthamoebae TaxID=91604 RepID=A0A077AVL9_9PROT|nr:hypothetical protein [Candidatus Paracaedibacter acanthamoebae]AIK95713.1 hypothetical protein ID47_01610 [Candidatus Paracaedibacter acanthamoebae]
MNHFPYCFFPTSVLEIDFTNDKYKVSQYLKDQFVALDKDFSTPDEALIYLNKVNQRPLFFHRLIDQGLTPIDISSVNYLYEEIYNPTRYETVSCIICRGEELDDQIGGFLKDIEELRIKKILLTERKNETLAIQAFNNGLIDFYVCQQDSNAFQLLEQYIEQGQQAYFQEIINDQISTLIKEGQANREGQILQDATFISYVQTLIQREKITEYYLLDVSGSFLFLNDQGRASVLFVFNNEQFKQYCQEVDQLLDQGYPFSPFTKEGLRARHKTVCFPFINAQAISDLNRYVAPVQVLQGQQRYYIAYNSDIDYL